MTYQDLILVLETYSPEQLQATVTILCPDTEEHRPVIAACVLTRKDTNVFDDGHIVLVLSAQQCSESGQTIQKGTYLWS